MTTLFITIHIIVCIALVLIVLLQTGKGDMGTAFGAGASQTLFGGTGATTFLSKLTTFVAVVFIVSSLTLAYVSTTQKSKSAVLNNVHKQEATQTDKDTNADKKNETKTNQ